MNKRVKKIIARFCSHWRLALLIVAGVTLQQLTFFQIIYPSNRLLPLAHVDGVDFGGWQKADAIKRLDNLYLKSSVSLYFGKAKKPYISPEIGELGLRVVNQSRLSSFDYPWYLRIIPTSIFWAQVFVYNQPEPEYSRDSDKLSKYLDNLFSEPCTAVAKDATLKFSGIKYTITPSQSGGKCDDIDVVRKTLSNIKPRLNNSRAQIGSTEVNPVIDDDAAIKFGDDLIKKVGEGVTIAVNGTNQAIPASTIFGWMDFSIIDEKLAYTLSSVKASDYLSQKIAPAVRVEPGVTTITTYDFTTSKKVEGKSGVGLDNAETLKNIKLAIDNGGTAKVATMTVAPTVTYKRSYSKKTDTGLSAMIQQYAEDQGGIKSVSLIELSGEHRRASFNADVQLVAASTYKLFVAYSTLRRIESGSWSWTDQILEGQDLSVCFNNMIVYSDNDCAEALLKKIGSGAATNEAGEIGCSKTSFITGTGYAKTSAADLALFLGQLQSGMILNEQPSRDILINAMKRNTYRSGIPAGVAGEVADKVGFGEGIINDAAIVYSPGGTYILVIMSEGSYWGAVAELASEIEGLRAE